MLADDDKSLFPVWSIPFELIGNGNRMLHRKCNLNEQQLLNYCCGLVIIIHLNSDSQIDLCHCAGLLFYYWASCWLMVAWWIPKFHEFLFHLFSYILLLSPHLFFLFWLWWLCSIHVALNLPWRCRGFHKGFPLFDLCALFYQLYQNV